jgi:hypothetical protein
MVAEFVQRKLLSEPLTAYERISMRVLAPRGDVPRTMGVRPNPANVAMSDFPFGKDFGFRSKRSHAETKWREKLLHDETRINLAWTPQPAPDDAEDQHKRSVLANSQYVCFLSDDKKWYIGRERWNGDHTEAGDRFGVEFEIWAGPFFSEAVAQRSMMLHLERGHNMDHDTASPLPDDRADLRAEAEKRNRVSRHQYVVRGDESEREIMDAASKIARTNDLRPPLVVPTEGTRAMPDPWAIRGRFHSEAQ